MFSWFKNKLKTKSTIATTSPKKEKEIEDAIEESLWEIKEEYDLPTEEIDNVVLTKRRNLDYLHKILSKNKNIV